ncbi:hypothetical protein [Streptomyces sp. NPDC006510]
MAAVDVHGARRRRSYRALDLMRAYAARDRVGVVEHLAHLETDQLE